jgi:hypothetical protein
MGVWISNCRTNRQVATVSPMSLSLLSLSLMSLSLMSLSPMSLSLRSAQIAQEATNEPVLALERMQWSLCLGLSRVLVLFVSFAPIYLSQAMIITCIMRFMYRSGFILFLGFVLVLLYWQYFIHSIMRHCPCTIFATPAVYRTSF